MRLIYSADDASRTGKGWYWERSDWKVSQSFRSEEQARAAFRHNALKFT